MKKLFSRLIAVLCVCAMLVSPAYALTVEQACSILDDYYYYELGEEARGADSLDELFYYYVSDPYTYYMDTDEYSGLTSSLDNVDTLVGLGTLSSFQEDGIHIVRVYPDGGADRIGLKKGDIIISIDGTSCVPASAEEHLEMLFGEAGSTVELTILRDGKSFVRTVTRRDIPISTTYSELINGNVGYIDCDSFGFNTAKSFTDAINKNSSARFWIVDLRDNPGGVSSSAADAAGIFTGSGDMMYFRNRDGFYEYIPYDGTRLTSLPLITLVNEDTASAAEVFAADIRDYRAGIIIGQRTYGKGSSQTVFDSENMPAVFNGDALKVTTDRFFSAAGNSNQYIGVIPTLLVEPGMEEAVAECLTTIAPAQPNGCVHLVLNGCDYYFYPPHGDSSEAMDALLEALPPDCEMYLGQGDTWTPVSAVPFASSCSKTYARRGFNDVPSYYQEINILATYGILQGSGDGNFYPSAKLTRAELCALLSQVLGVYYDGETLFTDVPEDSWYAGAVNAMAVLGFVNGTGGGRFSPDSYLTWQEFAVIMARFGAYLNMYLYDFSQMLEEEPIEFSSLNSWAPWSRNSIALLLTAYELEDGTPCPMVPSAIINATGLVTRAHAADTLCNMLLCTGLISY